MDPKKVRRPRRKQNYLSAGGPEVGTSRKNHPGYSGPGSLKSLAQGMMENKKSSDALEEEKLFSVSREVTDLLKGLKIMEKKDEVETQ